MAQNSNSKGLPSGTTFSTVLPWILPVCAVVGDAKCRHYRP
jgi:hypothetical protein